MKVIDRIPPEKYGDLCKFIGTPQYNQIMKELEQ
jgi:hypothetical protein